MTSGRVLGVDACKAGWVGIVLDEHARLEAHVAPTIGELVDTAERGGRLAVVGVDIPIGLPDTGRRAADVLARAEIGPLWSSVFLTPVRAALEAPDHATAVRRHRAATGEGVSIQAFSLRVKLFEVERWIRDAARNRGAPLRVVEVHPEVVFARLAGAPLVVRKSRWAGAERRRALLAGAGVHVVGELGRAGAVAGVDDALDAAAVAWSARRVAIGQACSMPDPPEVFADGLEAAIWC